MGGGAAEPAETATAEHEPAGEDENDRPVA
jgi:hypothetical protein